MMRNLDKRALAETLATALADPDLAVEKAEKIYVHEGNVAAYILRVLDAVYLALDESLEPYDPIATLALGIEPAADPPAAEDAEEVEAPEMVEVSTGIYEPRA